MTKFRPCIDLHDGKVKQIVGSSLSDSGAGLKTNFETDRSPAWFAELYKKDGIKGGHVIMLGKGNVEAAKAALAAYPGGLQVGGGITADNAMEYIGAGASHVIVTSWIFPEGKLDRERLERLSKTVGRDHLVLDLSCKRIAGASTGDSVLHGKDCPRWKIAINRWQTLIDIEITAETLNDLARYCDEFRAWTTNSSCSSPKTAPSPARTRAAPSRLPTWNTASKFQTERLTSPSDRR